MTSRHTSPSTGTPLDRRSDLQFLLPEASTQFGTVFGGASVIHLGLLGLLFLVLWVRPPLGTLTENMPTIIDSQTLTFLATPGTPGGGGGGGDKSPLPPRTSPELAVRNAEAIVPTATPEPERPTDLEPAAIVPALAPNNLPPAMVETGPSTIGDLGPGNAPGAGFGDKGGIGPGGNLGGPGPGDGPGIGLGPGGGGVTAPTLIERVRPSYTSEAMIRGKRGEVVLSCVVLETGAMGKCDVVRSLDGNAYGLDDEALRAASKWRFKPGMSGNRPVPVRVNIVLEFNMR